ncbi:uncharacterized protein BcabD6B2_24540 [Babesia caballi]|uniref:Uncharacterized protein n=1 Tax=Babesia caballi TaxID=5871 RepID=A0AAV4LT68_BABCB|nr:hypothetical protein, conserved [Babesia caballi]
MKFNFATVAAALLVCATSLVCARDLEINVMYTRQDSGVWVKDQLEQRHLQYAFGPKAGSKITRVVYGDRRTDGCHERQKLYTAPEGHRVHGVFTFGTGITNLIVIYASDRILAYEKHGIFYKEVKVERNFANSLASVSAIKLHCEDGKYRVFDVDIDTSADPAKGKFEIAVRPHGHKTIRQWVAAVKRKDTPYITYRTNDDYLQDVSLTGYNLPTKFQSLISDEQAAEEAKAFRRMVLEAAEALRSEGVEVNFIDLGNYTDQNGDEPLPENAIPVPALTPIPVPAVTPAPAPTPAGHSISQFNLPKPQPASDKNCNSSVVDDEEPVAEEAQESPAFETGTPEVADVSHLDIPDDDSVTSFGSNMDDIPYIHEDGENEFNELDGETRPACELKPEEVEQGGEQSDSSSDSDSDGYSCSEKTKRKRRLGKRKCD